jgi:amino acid adenylation domain-containing protein
MYRKETIMAKSSDKLEIAEHSRDLPGYEADNGASNQESSARSQLAEPEGLLAMWNDTRQPYPRDAIVPELVAAQAGSVPDAVALVVDGQALSYRELNRRANQVAHYLQGLGVRANVLVGMCIERSVDLVVGLLGILKAGGAYVPLDPIYPPERLAFMMKDTQVPVLLTHQHFAANFSAQDVRVVCLDTDADMLARQSETDPVPSAVVTDLAYVIYTSGSTGQPKGVQITHDGLLNLIFWHQRAFAVTPRDRATQLTSPAFDATGWELWPYLTCGASVYLPDEATRVDPRLLRDWLIEQGITISFVPTALAESMITLDWPAAASLHLLLTGADTLQHYPPPNLPFALINNYGPTEATVVATSGQIFPTDHPEILPSIGRPIANTHIFILDESLQPAPIGEPGELYIGGAGLSRGYLHRPELTAERFIPHPFSDDPAARLYKTGDLARYLPDGQIAFIGRADYQIKIRGYRIEPNEITAVLNQHPAIQSSFVMAQEGAPGEKRLVAYIVTVPGAQVTSRFLQDALRAHLPDYMVPAVFVLLDTLPMTPNGKVNRAALPAPDATNMLREEVISKPMTPTEERISSIVASLLKLENVGLDENFFMLGGHSLLGTQVVAQVAETFGVELPLRALFDAPTIRQLSAEIERRLVAKLEMMSEDEALRLLEAQQTAS